LFRGDDAPYKLESLFILPESKGVLIERITERAPISDEELKRRIASVEKEMTYAELCDAQVINAQDKLEEAVAEIEQKLGLD
jgi:guanylate kinase